MTQADAVADMASPDTDLGELTQAKSAFHIELVRSTGNDAIPKHLVVKDPLDYFRLQAVVGNPIETTADALPEMAPQLKDTIAPAQSRSDLTIDVYCT